MTANEPGRRIGEELADRADEAASGQAAGLLPARSRMPRSRRGPRASRPAEATPEAGAAADGRDVAEARAAATAGEQVALKAARRDATVI
jgi:hypothetical protein